MSKCKTCVLNKKVERKGYRWGLDREGGGGIDVGEKAKVDGGGGRGA